MSIDIKLILIAMMPFILVVLFQLIRLSFFSKNTLSSNELSIQAIVHSGIIQTMRSVFFSIFLVFLLVFLVFLGLGYVYKAHYFRTILMFFSLFSSFGIGYFSIKFLLRYFVNFYIHLKDKDLLSFIYKSNPFSILISSVISFLMLELLSMILLIKISLINNWFKFSDYLQGTILTHAGYKNISVFLNSNYADLFILVIISGYFFGMIFHSFFARFTFSSMAVSADTTADLIGYTNYDLPENDIRNVATIADFIGDYLKNGYASVLTMVSTLLTAVYFVSFFGGIFGIVTTSFNSFFCILIPFHLIGVGILVYVFYTFINFFINRPGSFLSYFVGYLIILFFSLILWANSVHFVFPSNLILIPSRYFFLLLAAILFSFILFLFLWRLLCANSTPLSSLVNLNKLGIFSSLSKGFFYSFLYSFIIGLILALFIAFIYLIFGFKLNIFRDLYHFGLISIILFICFLPLFHFVLTYPVIDNISGLSQMFVYPKDEQNQLLVLESNLSALTAIFYILMAVILILLLPLFIFFLLFILLRRYLDLNLIEDKTHDLNFEKLMEFKFDFHEVLHVFEIHVLNPEFIAGLILGIVLLFFTYAYVMHVLVKNYSLIKQVTDESFANPELWSGDVLPDYFKLQEKLVLNTNHLVRLFVVLFLILILILSVLVNAAGVIAFIISTSITSFVFTVFFVISGTLWSNAKKQVDFDELAQGTSHHVSIFMCDKLGDIFKDALAPISIEFTKLIFIFLSLVIGIVLIFDHFVGFIH